MRGFEYAELVAFVAVVDQGSFARAAKQLHIAPSSLSQTIKKLEGRVGVELLHRTTRNVSMTGAGKRLFERFKPAMKEMDAALSDVHDLAAVPAGLVRLHLPRAAFASLLVDCNGWFGSNSARGIEVFPFHRLGIFIVLSDISHEFSLEVRNRCKDTSSDYVAFDFCEPQFNLIEP